MIAAILALAATGVPAAERPAAGLAAPIEDGAELLPSPAGAGLTPVRFSGERDWPALRYRAGAPLDWSGAGALLLPVDNPGDQPFRLLLRLDDDPRADGGDRSLTGLVTLPAHARGRVVLPLVAGPSGMRGRPVATGPAQPGDLHVDDLRGSVDRRHVVAFHVSGLRTPDDRTIAIGQPVLRDAPAGHRPDGPIADRYGQSVAGQWPEKVGSDADLRDKLAEADRALARPAGPSGDRGVGGTGFFRVDKVGGRWRLVSPAGQPFFSLGVDAVTASNPTVVEGRGSLFADLPAPGTPLARTLRTSPDGATFDVGEANLQRAFGPAWRTAWTRTVVARLKAWGFNTLGNWSDPDLAASGLASVLFYDVEGASASVPMEGGRALPDPFDPRYAAVADAVAAAMTAQGRKAPALLGYFSGNEMPWGSADRPADGLAAHVLRLGGDSPAKAAFIGVLRTRHPSADALAAAWGLHKPEGWAGLLDRAVSLPASLTPSARRDLATFEGTFADRYFATVAQAIKRHDPDHLYLGTRFADAPPEVVAACARWCDVLSFNVYGTSPAEAAPRWRDFDRPVLIGEFHFGSTDRGSFWPGMVDAGAEERRGSAYAAYLRGALADPAIVGVHWYQYADEPLTGRPYDGENGHIGLVAVTGVPYAGFVAAVARANAEASRAFASAAKRDAPHP